MDESSALSFLVSLNEPQIQQGAAYGFGGGIERTRTLMRLLGCARQPGFVITVTGSKGKSSTCMMIAAILNASGLKVGSFTGPHLHHYRERTRISGAMISREGFVRYIQQIRDLLNSDQMDTAAMGVPTTFECLTAIAAKYFHDEQVDGGLDVVMWCRARAHYSDVPEVYDAVRGFFAEGG